MLPVHFPLHWVAIESILLISQSPRSKNAREITNAGKKNGTNLRELHDSRLSACARGRARASGRMTPLVAADGGARALEPFPTRDPKWQHRAAPLCGPTRGGTEPLAAARGSIFFLPEAKTHYRIYEKTHVDLYNHFKPEGMHIFFVKLTFLLSLIAQARGELRARQSCVSVCVSVGEM